MPAGDRALQRSREQARLLGLDRLNLFVPALMSVGIVFWLLSEVTEVMRGRLERSRDRQANLAAAAVADEVLGRPSGSVAGLRPRPVYLLVGATLIGGAAYVFIGSFANFVRTGGYVEGRTWLLALAGAASTVAVIYGATALAVFARWPQPPAWTRGALMHTPLGAPALSDEDHLGRPSWRLSTALAASVALTAVVAALVAWSPGMVASWDDHVARWLRDHDPLGQLSLLDPAGWTRMALAIALLTGLAAWRCRVLVVAYTASVIGGLLFCAALRPLVAHTTAGSPFASDSFPSTSMMLVVVFAGLVPLALAVLLDRTWLVRPLRTALAIGAIISGAHQVAVDARRPVDVIGGALIGLVLVLTTQWAVDNRASHRSCRGCPWSATARVGSAFGAVPIHPSAQGVLRIMAHVGAALAAVGLGLLALSIHLPVDAGYGFGRPVERTVQLSLAALASVGALLAWRWQAAGAALLALAAAGAGIFASVEYRPGVATLLTAVLMIPAVLVWLSWQHTRKPREIVVLAVVTALLLGCTWVGATTVYDRYFGPTHPESSVAAVTRDRVDWVWSGGLSAEGITVTAHLVKGASSARLAVTSTNGGQDVESGDASPDEDRLVRFRVDGLAPDTSYTYVVVVDGHADEGRGHGTFHTPAVGPYSFRVTAASCARTGSNGAVYDAIRAEDPLFHLALGDMHYQNIVSTDPSDFIDAYTRALTTSAQAALARAVPLAYVWDDHDYGPNDADASFPGRSAVRDAYRRAVPHYDVTPGDAPINQAFTIGRVRFVLTDARSEHQPGTVLGQAQRDWLIEELRRSSATSAVVVWVNSLPWIEAPDPASDGWAGAAEERAQIAEAIAAAGISNLLMVSGDAHMVAIDDGTNSGYSSTGWPGFPLLHAAALDRPGNVKGGPYSHGTFPGSGQFGMLVFDDDGSDTVHVQMSGHTWDGRTLVTYDRTFQVPPLARVPS
jgi:hypothetical protein